MLFVIMLLYNAVNPLHFVLHMSIIVQQDATIYSFIIFLQTALHVSGYTLIHHQEHTQIVITVCVCS